MKKYLQLIALVFAVTFVFAACGQGQDAPETPDAPANYEADPAPPDEPPYAPENGQEAEPVAEVSLEIPEGYHSFGEYVSLGSMIATFIDEIEWASHNDAVVFRVPLNILNVSHVNQDPRSLDFVLTGPDGQVIDNVGGYFEDYDISRASPIAMNGLERTYIHFLYNGDGVYTVRFQMFGDMEMAVAIPVVR